jgi:hypothetical protein
MNAVAIVTGADALTSRRILSWFARQAEAVQVQIMRRKHREFMRLQGQHTKLGKAALDLAALVLACRDSGWADEQAYHSSKSISDISANRIAERRRAAAQACRPHRDQVRSWLMKHWGKVMDIRRAGLSWRRVAAVIAADHGVTVSHTTLHSYWRRLDDQF